jgi:hypothetical protein
MMRSPSHTNHITLLCGAPLGRIVARWAKSGLSRRSAWVSGTAGQDVMALSYPATGVLDRATARKLARLATRAIG